MSYRRGRIMLTIPECADILGVSANTIRRLIAAGDFWPALRVGGQWKISRPLLDRYARKESAPGNVA